MTSLAGPVAQAKPSSAASSPSALADCADDQNIQVILRQAVYFLRETRAAPSVLRPPAVDGIPRPLAATLAQPAISSSVGTGGETALGLYAARTEVAALREMLAAAKALRALEEGEKRGGAGDGDGLEVDAGP